MINYLIDIKLRKILYKNIFSLEVFYRLRKVYISTQIKNGLEVEQYNSYGLHYSNTLNIWRNEFTKKWDEISKQGFDLTF